MKFSCKPGDAQICAMAFVQRRAFYAARCFTVSELLKALSLFKFMQKLYFDMFDYGLHCLKCLFFSEASKALRLMGGGDQMIPASDLKVMISITNHDFGKYD